MLALPFRGILPGKRVEVGREPSFDRRAFGGVSFRLPLSAPQEKKFPRIANSKSFQQLHSWGEGERKVTR